MYVLLMEVQWNSCNQDNLGTRGMFSFEGYVLFRDSNSVLFIKVSLFQGVLLKSFHCIYKNKSRTAV